MRRKLSAVSAFLIMSTILSGCSLKSEYKEDDYDVVATYIAHAVLKNDPEFAYRLVNIEEDENSTDDVEDETASSDNTTDENANNNNSEVKDEAVTEKTEPEDTDNTNESDDSSVLKEDKNTDIATVLGVKNIEFEYASFSKKTSLGDNSSYEINPDSGKIFYIVTIKITNTSDKKQKVSLTPDGITYRLTADDESALPQLTALNNDILYYEGTIDAGKSKKAVVVFELPQKDYKNISISISSDNGEYNYTIK